MSTAAAPAGNANDDVIRFLFSTVLGFAIVGGSFILKVPQIINILKNGNTKGLSLTSNVLEMTSYVIGASWGVARQLNFKDYGEGLIVTAQLAVLVLLIGAYTKRFLSVALVVSVLLSALYGLSFGMIPRSIHELLLTAQLGLSLSSRVPQIYLNYRQRSTGVLSFATYFLSFGGSAARLVTTTLNVPWESGKGQLLLQFALAFVLNFILLAQIVRYRPVAEGRKNK
jgi:mannose-P-dolichol utilization defect protein 1